MTDVDYLIIRLSASIRDALEQLQRTAKGVLLLVGDKGQLLRTITDGDLRRLLLAGFGMNDMLSALPRKQPIVAGEDIHMIDALQIMSANRIYHLPVVDVSGRSSRVLFRRDLDTKILLSTPHLSEFEIGYVEEAFRSNWVSPIGPNVDAFEQEIADYLGVKGAVAVSSGTAALHLSLHLLDVKPGDIIFGSSLTFVASANPVLYMGAVPVFIDSEPTSWNMSPLALERGLAEADHRGRLPKAVIVVNLYGQSADMDSLRALCDRYEVPVVEDAFNAESLGATYKGKRSGAFGQIGILSFNGNKIITTSGGGMLVSNDMDLLQRAKFLSTQARESTPWYEHREIGFNYRMSNVLAGIGRGQLKVLDDRVEARRRVFDCYVTGLKELEAFTWMPEPPFSRCTRWLTVASLDSCRAGTIPANLIDCLARSGIEARHVWKPMHRQPLFSGCEYYPHTANYSFSDHVFETGVCLPSGSNMTAQQQNRIIEVIRVVLKNQGSGQPPDAASNKDARVARN